MSIQLFHGLRLFINKQIYCAIVEVLFTNLRFPILSISWISLFSFKVNAFNYLLHTVILYLKRTTQMFVIFMIIMIIIKMEQKKNWSTAYATIANITAVANMLRRLVLVAVNRRTRIYLLESMSPTPTYSCWKNSRGKTTSNWRRIDRKTALGNRKISSSWHWRASLFPL